MHCFFKLIYNGSSYEYNDSSDLEMCILSLFLLHEVRFNTNEFKEIAFDKEFEFTTGNIIRITKEGNYFFFSDYCSEEKIPTELKISCDQYVTLLDDWQEKVCDKRPKHVIIEHENNQFIIETSDEEFLV